MKTFLIISATLLTKFAFGQTDSIYSFKLLNLKDAVKISYKTKSKEFYKAISFRNSFILKFQSNKRADWIVPVGAGYYGWEGLAFYNSKEDTLELWKNHHQDQIIVGYSSFIDLNDDKKPDIVFSNIYDQFLKTQSNWTDIYFSVKEKYIPVLLKGYLIGFTKKDKGIIRIKTVEQPFNKTDLYFVLHAYEVDAHNMTVKETAAQYINRKQVRQTE